MPLATKSSKPAKKLNIQEYIEFQSIRQKNSKLHEKKFLRKSAFEANTLSTLKVEK